MGLNDVNAYWDGTRSRSATTTPATTSPRSTWSATSSATASTTTPRAASAPARSPSSPRDVFGALTESYTNEPAPYDTPDYTVGEKVNLVGSGPIRYMYHPSLISGTPDCYSSSVPSMETHTAAGPGNHWFYLVAEGTNPTDGQPTSPTCNSTTITGIGIQNAGKIFYNAMLAKTTSMSYLKYRTATLTAAKNLFPGQLHQLQRRQGGLGRGQRAGPVR